MGSLNEPHAPVGRLGRWCEVCGRDWFHELHMNPPSPPHGDRLVPGSPPGFGAARPPFIDVTPFDGAAGIEGVAVSVVWDVETGMERDHVRVYRDGALVHERTRVSPPAQTVGRDEDAQPPRGPVSGAWFDEGGWAVRQNNRYSGDDRGEDGAPAQGGGERSDSAA